MEAIDRPLSGFAMLALIGDFDQPLPCLTIHIGKIGELAPRPKVLAEVANGAFDFALGNKRAMQIVVMMAQKFSLSRTRSIP